MKNNYIVFQFQPNVRYLLNYRILTGYISQQPCYHLEHQLFMGLVLMEEERFLMIIPAFLTQEMYMSSSK